MQAIIMENRKPILDALNAILAAGRLSINQHTKEVDNIGDVLNKFHQELTDIVVLLGNQKYQLALKRGVGGGILDNRAGDSGIVTGSTAHLATDNPFKFVYKNPLGILSYGETKDNKEIPVRRERKIKKTIRKESIYGVPIPSTNFPIVEKLKDIPTAISWFNGDQHNGAGLYICIVPNFYVKVPFPNTTDGTKDYSRIKSIKCKNTIESNCLRYRREIASKHNTTIRECTYAHDGDVYTKIGTNHRCQILTRFGAHETLLSDMETVCEKDIQTMLMYALSDLLLAYIWGKTNKFTEQTVFENIEICT